MELMTPRLILREFTLEDEPAVHAYASDEAVIRYTDWGPNTVEDTKEFFRETFESAALEPRASYMLAITLPQGPLVGGVRLGITSRADHAADFGYVIDAKYWGQGIATEATKRLVAFGFDELDLHRIYATCHPENIGSARVLEKSGFQLEGRLRDDKFVRGAWRDSLLYAISEKAK
ncbi:putative ribosomal N-acetyltransferase YdaF [mine drainage metagenome]|uniref:Putative ribosomal N-acetyltransferase YdaF n=1 Tax=mine drainage metagenome TaxID=410659 RepID=A0A1J5PZ97_9ZZZZ